MKRRKPTRYSLADREGSITATELRRSGRETQLDVMRAWFFAAYEDPAECTPYESAEGGYIYIWGGPYEPEEELQGEFGGLIPDRVIEELAKELRAISWEWTGHPRHDNAEDYFFSSIAQTTDHHKAFEEALKRVKDLLDLKPAGKQRTHLRRLLYVNVITCLETYLSDVFISAAGNNKFLLRKFIESSPEFKSEKVPVSEVFKVAEEMEKRAKLYLLDVVWHHLGRVKRMFWDTLNIRFPDDTSKLFKAVIVRHDLVHRNGKMKTGGQHNITVDAVIILMEEARSFVSYIDEQMTIVPLVAPPPKPLDLEF